jgi:hypothetical protein
VVMVFFFGWHLVSKSPFQPLLPLNPSTTCFAANLDIFPLPFIFETTSERDRDSDMDRFKFSISLPFVIGSLCLYRFPGQLFDLFMSIGIHLDESPNGPGFSPGDDCMGWMIERHAGSHIRMTLLVRDGQPHHSNSHSLLSDGI